MSVRVENRSFTLGACPTRLRRGLSLRWSHHAYEDFQQADLLSDLGQHVWPLFSEGRLSPQLARTFPIADAETAFAELATNQVSGKVVLIVDPSLI